MYVTLMADDVCKMCGKKLKNDLMTHCSDKCLFANLRNSTSISGTPIEDWADENPWV